MITFQNAVVLGNLTLLRAGRSALSITRTRKINLRTEKLPSCRWRRRPPILFTTIPSRATRSPSRPADEWNPKSSTLIKRNSRTNGSKDSKPWWPKCNELLKYKPPKSSEFHVYYLTSSLIFISKTENGQEAEACGEFVPWQACGKQEETRVEEFSNQLPGQRWHLVANWRIVGERQVHRVQLPGPLSLPLLTSFSHHWRNCLFVCRGDSFVARPCNAQSARTPAKLKANVARCVTLSDDGLTWWPEGSPGRCEPPLNCVT